MGDEANLSKQAAADRAERYVREQLNPAPGQEHLSPLLNKRKEFLAKLNENLDANYYSTPEKRQAKLEEAGKEFDAAIVARAREGAAAGGDANTYKLMDPAEKREKETSTGLIRGIINTVVGGLGGIFGFLWDLLKHLPIVGDMIASIGDKRTPEEKARDTKAAGVADKLSVPLEVQGITVKFSDEEREKIFNGLRKPETQVAAQPATPASPTAATPESNTASPEVLQSARDAATAARTAGANDPRDVGLNGGLPPAPLVAVAVANNATGHAVG
ncbi:MAG: hypothetical protein SFW63_02955 [Alphaproteobacteria bacterium]|nr:hypothetical protein [Alphaproteobacteria bacterium]